MSKTSAMKEQQMDLLSTHIIDEQHVELLPPRALMQGLDLVGGLACGLPLVGGLVGGVCP
jgi:hypothetical protein